MKMNGNSSNKREKNARHIQTAMIATNGSTKIDLVEKNRFPELN
jgi:hypothetical protein